MKPLILHSIFADPNTKEYAPILVVIATTAYLNEPPAHLRLNEEKSEEIREWISAWDKGCRCVVTGIDGDEHYPVETFDEIAIALGAEYVRPQTQRPLKAVPGVTDVPEDVLGG